MATVQDSINDRAKAETSATVYPVFLPAQPTLPAIVYQRVSTVPLRTHEQGRAGLARSRWQLTCWADSYEDVIALADEVNAAFDGWSDRTGDPYIGSSFVVMDLDDWDHETKRHRRIIDIEIQANERTS